MSPPSSTGTSARLRSRATWAISRAHARAASLLGAGFEHGGDGLRGHHFRLLDALDEWGPASQADLGRFTGIDRSDVTAALTALEGRGLVARSVDPGHKRRNIVELTPDGSAALDRLDHVVDGVQEELLAPLTARQRTELIRLLCLVAGGGPD